MWRYMRYCKRCGGLKEMASKGSKICPDCYKPPHNKSQLLLSGIK